MPEYTPPVTPPSLPSAKKSGGLGWVGIGIFLVLAVPVLLGGAYWLSHSRGERDWEKAQARLTAEGETLAAATLWPPAVPPEENFCLTPGLAGITEVIGGDEKAGEPAQRRKRLMALDFTRGRPNAPRLEFSESVDWAAWRRYLADDAARPVPAGEPSDARAVFAAFEPHRALFDELAAAAAARSQAQFTPPIGERVNEKWLIAASLPHMTPVFMAAKAVMFRGRAAVACGEAEVARDAVRTLCRLRDAFILEGILTAQLVAISIEAQTCRLIADGMAARLWTEEDYRLWEKELPAANWQSALLRAHRLEMASQAQVLGALTPEALRKQAAEGQDITLLPFTPPGWKDKNRALLVRLTLDHLIGPLRDASWPELLAHQETLAAETAAARKWYDPYSALVALSVGVYDSMHLSTVHVEYMRRQILAACALERFWLREKRYPAALAELVPHDIAEIPADLDGQPLRYAPDPANGRYRLWSVGRNLRDDWQGQPPPASGSRIKERDKLDWVLEFAASSQ